MTTHPFAATRRNGLHSRLQPVHHHGLLDARFPADLPVTGAWRPGDPPGDRLFTEVASSEHPFALEGGGKLRGIRVAYETWGKLDEYAANAVLVCHALTGDSHAAGASSHSHPAGGWWKEMIGPGRAIDTDRYFVVCSNVLGGCQGTTGPADPGPSPPPPDESQGDPGCSADDVGCEADSSSGGPRRGDRPSAGDGIDAGPPRRAYGARFPVVTVRDMVRVQAMLADDLGVRRWLAVVGGSMGGMQVLEWAVMYPRRVSSILPLATCAASSPMQIAWSAVGRLAIAGDPDWNGGDYYDEPCGPWWGLAVARELAQVTYRSAQMFEDRFDRNRFDVDRFHDLWGRFQIESYLDHHGQKLVRRFDANSYLILNKAMDLHDIGRGRGGARSVLGRIAAPTLTASISSDALYPPSQQSEIRDGIAAGGGDCRYLMIDSSDGHDGFLLEHEQLEGPVGDFLDEMHDRRASRDDPKGGDVI